VVGWGFKQGYRKIVVVGTDTPWMGSKRIVQALRLLKPLMW